MEVDGAGFNAAITPQHARDQQSGAKMDHILKDITADGDSNAGSATLDTEVRSMDEGTTNEIPSEKIRLGEILSKSSISAPYLYVILILMPVITS